MGSIIETLGVMERNCSLAPCSRLESLKRGHKAIGEGTACGDLSHCRCQDHGDQGHWNTRTTGGSPRTAAAVEWSLPEPMHCVSMHSRAGEVELPRSVGAQKMVSKDHP